MIKKINYYNVIVYGFIIIFILIIISRIWSAIVLRNQTNITAIPIVTTVIAKNVVKTENVVLPGNVRAWHEAMIYARTSGYITKWYVDIGDQVQKEQLLAEIETPELDAQLRQAQANLQVVIAQNKLAQSTSLRWLALRKSDSVSQQETDEKVNAAHALSASVIAMQANYDRLCELVKFERVTAPFAGMITSRTTDIGALINSGSSTQAKPLFHLEQTNPLRVYVRIPQNYSALITPDMVVKLYFAEYPQQHFTAKLLKTANSIDPNTRTLLAQFILDNKNHQLLPGGYTEVHFSIPALAKIVKLPINTLIFRAEGLEVATVTKTSNKKNVILLKSITIGRDFGRYVEVINGINVGDTVVMNPSDSIATGDIVKVKKHKDNSV